MGSGRSLTRSATGAKAATGKRERAESKTRAKPERLFRQGAHEDFQQAGVEGRPLRSRAGGFSPVRRHASRPASPQKLLAREASQKPQGEHDSPRSAKGRIRQEAGAFAGNAFRGSRVLKNRTPVYFQGEPEIKYGGLIQEFFTIISRELCNPKAQIFRHFQDSHCIWFSRQVSAQDDIYFLIGNLFGIALQNQKIIALPFPLALFKKLANMKPTLEDLKELSPKVGRSLQRILNESDDNNLKNMMLDFTVVEPYKGSIIEVDLKENGANIPVTLYNRKEYVDAYVNYTFNDSVKKQFEGFACGFQRGCPSTTWKMFLPVELRSILFGHTTYNWDQLKKNIKYYGFEESDDTIKNFWIVFHDFPEEKKEDFLAFLTGTVHIPGRGMDNFIITIVDAGEDYPDQAFPVIYTCTKSLYLPRYTNKHVLKKMLLYAIENFRDVGLA